MNFHYCESVKFSVSILFENETVDTIVLWFMLLQMEQIVEKMQDEASGVPVKTVKSFMSKIPSVFTGE